MIDVGVVPRLIELLKDSAELVSLSVLTPALRTVGNIVTGNDAQVFRYTFLQQVSYCVIISLQEFSVFVASMSISKQLCIKTGRKTLCSKVGKHNKIIFSFQLNYCLIL